MQERLKRKKSKHTNILEIMNRQKFPPIITFFILIHRDTMSPTKFRKQILCESRMAYAYAYAYYQRTTTGQ